MSNFSQELALFIPRLRRYARALTHNTAWADDLVQDTMERALNRQWLFRANSNLCSWLFTMLYRLYLNDASRHHRTHAVAEEDAPEPSTSGDMTLQLDLQQALGRLSAEHRAVILLVGLEQLSYKEAAQALGIPVGTLMSRLMRAREQLRLLLSGESAAPPSPATQSQLTRIK
jgi:RNA polymerase sigma-70 factor (ECF subfamily)